MFTTAGQNEQIARQPDKATVVVGATLGAATGLDVRHAAGLKMKTPADSGTVTITVYENDELTGTYLPSIDAAGNAVTIDIDADKVYDLPEALYASHFLKFVTDGAAFTATILGKG